MLALFSQEKKNEKQMVPWRLSTAVLRTTKLLNFKNREPNMKEQKAQLWTAYSESCLLGYKQTMVCKYSNITLAFSGTEHHFHSSHGETEKSLYTTPSLHFTHLDLHHTLIWQNFITAISHIWGVARGFSGA